MLFEQRGPRGVVVVEPENGLCRRGNCRYNNEQKGQKNSVANCTDPAHDAVACAVKLTM